VKKSGHRTPVVRVELLDKWGLPRTDGGKALQDLLKGIVLALDDSWSWGVFENKQADAAQVQIRKGSKRESLILEEIPIRGLSTSAVVVVENWVNQKLTSETFGSVPNIVVCSWDGQPVP
jgi:hypothetical protein